MPIDPAGTPAVNPQVDTDYTSNVIRSPYSSTTEDLLDRLIKAVNAVSINVSGGTFTNNGFTSGWMIDDGTGYPVWVVVTRDAGTGVVTVETFEEPNGVAYVVIGALVPIEVPECKYKTYRLDGNSANATALPWEDESTLYGTPVVDGTVGRAVHIAPPYKYFDLRVLNSSDDDPAAGFYIDKNKTRFYSCANGAVAGVLGIQRGSNTQQGNCVQDMYVEAVGNCQIEITLTLT